MSNNQVPDGVFFTSEDQDSLMGSSGTINYDIQQSFDPLSLWHSPPFSSISLEEAYHEIGGYSNMLTDLSSFEAPSSLQPQQVNTSEIPCLEEIVLHGLEKGQSSGTKRKQASDSLQMQTEETDVSGRVLFSFLCYIKNSSRVSYSHFNTLRYANSDDILFA